MVLPLLVGRADALVMLPVLAHAEVLILRPQLLHGAHGPVPALVLLFLLGSAQQLVLPAAFRSMLLPFDAATSDAIDLVLELLLILFLVLLHFLKLLLLLL